MRSINSIPASQIVKSIELGFVLSKDIEHAFRHTVWVLTGVNIPIIDNIQEHEFYNAYDSIIEGRLSEYNSIAYRMGWEAIKNYDNLQLPMWSIKQGFDKNDLEILKQLSKKQ